MKLPLPAPAFDTLPLLTKLPASSRRSPAPVVLPFSTVPLVKVPVTSDGLAAEPVTFTTPAPSEVRLPSTAPPAKPSVPRLVTSPSTVPVPVMLVLAPAAFSRSEASVPLTVSWLALVVPPATLSSPAMTATASSCKVSVPPMLLLPLFSSRPSTEALPVTSPPLSTVVPKPAPFT